MVDTVTYEEWANMEELNSQHTINKRHTGFQLFILTQSAYILKAQKCKNGGSSGFQNQVLYGSLSGDKILKYHQNRHSREQTKLTLHDNFIGEEIVILHSYMAIPQTHTYLSLLGRSIDLVS